MTKPRYYNEKTNFASPLALHYVDVPLRTHFSSPSEVGTDISTSLEQRRTKAVTSLLNCFKY